MLVWRRYIKTLNYYEYKEYKWLLLFGIIPLFISIHKGSKT